MFVLYELIDLLPKTLHPVLSGKGNKLLDFLRKNRGLDRDKAALLFFGTSSKNQYFTNLKNRLKKELLGYIITHPSDWANTEYRKLYDEGYKKFATYRILLSSGKRKAAIEMAKDLFRNLAKLELYGLTHLVAIDLHFHYSSMTKSTSLANRYGKEVQKYAELVQVMSEIRTHHSRVALICNNRDSFTPKMVEEIKDAAERIIPYLSLNAICLNRFIYDVIISRYAVEYDYERMLTYCNKALNFFPKDYVNYQNLRYTFLQKKVIALTALNKLEEGKEVAKEAGKMVPVGSFSWHLALIRRVIICLHAKDYQEAYELYKAHAKQSCHFSTLKEYWLIIRGYLYFLIKIGVIEQYSEERFNLGKFLNETPIYAQDKSGNNINILLIQIIVQLQRKQYGKIIDSIDALKAYERSYTRDPETLRANLLITMIVKMEKASFHRVATERKTQKLLDRLLQTPSKPKLNLAIEIIPYEALWGFILEMLDHKSRGITVRTRSMK